VNIRFRLVLVGLGLACNSLNAIRGTCAEGEDDTTAEATATDQLRDAVREVQEALGGPVTNQFPQLQAAPETTPWWKQFSGTLEAGAPPVATASDHPWPTWWTPARPRTVVTAVAESSPTAPAMTPQLAGLRRTAAELEMIANRLEEFELYRQADALRELAQRFRADAREGLAQRRGEPHPHDADPEGMDEPGHTGHEPADGAFHPYPPTGAEYGGSVSHDSAASHEHDEASGHAHDERSVIVGPAPE
jgi:hypothetical protein